MDGCKGESVWGLLQEEEVDDRGKRKGAAVNLTGLDLDVVRNAPSQPASTCTKYVGGYVNMYQLTCKMSIRRLHLGIVLASGCPLVSKGAVPERDLRKILDVSYPYRYRVCT